MPSIVRTARVEDALPRPTTALIVEDDRPLAAVPAFLRREWLQSVGLVSVGGAAALM